MAKKHKTNWIPRAAVGLLYLVLLSTWLLAGLSARFSTGANASDAARVAAFNVTESSSMRRDFAVTMKPGDKSEKITVDVTNSSETAVSYTISFVLDGNLPLTVVPADDATAGTSTAGAATQSSASGTTSALTQQEGALIWTTDAEMAGSEKTYNFQLNWDSDKNNYQYAEGIESITVELTAVQED